MFCLRFDSSREPCVQGQSTIDHFPMIRYTVNTLVVNTYKEIVRCNSEAHVKWQIQLLNFLLLCFIHISMLHVACGNKGTSRFCWNEHISPDVQLACALCLFAAGFHMIFWLALWYESQWHNQQLLVCCGSHQQAPQLCICVSRQSRPTKIHSWGLWCHFCCWLRVLCCGYRWNTYLDTFS